MNTTVSDNTVSQVVRRFGAVLAIAGALSGVSLCALAQKPGVIGCYRANRPLGTAASADGVPGTVGERMGEAGPALATLGTFRLLGEGHVDRPATIMREWWQRGSRWTIAGDTLVVQLSTGTSGWQLHLVLDLQTADSAYVGKALYLTDVIVHDSLQWRPPLVAVRVTREHCAN